MRPYKLPEIVLNLKGNATQFLNGITSNTLDALHNAFLNQHGRIIATFRQQRISDEEFLIAVPSVAVNNLLKHLERYARLSRTQIAESPVHAYVDLDENKIIWSADEHVNAGSGDEFTLCRLNHQIPLMGIDYQADEFILNVHEYDYVSYTKGCFLGQEPVAKVHNRSKPSRRLIVQYEDQLTVQDALLMTSKILDPAFQRIKGFVSVSNK